jgi:molybdopterin/thiamine biosynthesis adenylyltransferase
MNVGDLKKMLEKYPDDMEILNGRYSDYDLVEENEWSVVKAVKQDHWVMRSHPTMSEENKRNEKDFLYLEGN